MNKTGIVRDIRYLNHRTPDRHPEHSARLKAIYDMIEGENLMSRLRDVAPRMADPSEIHLIHTPEYLTFLASTAGMEQYAFTGDTLASEGSFEAAMLAAGGTFEAIRKVVSGALRNAFVLVRPPGHHAEKSRAMGFCLLNNVALGAGYARKVLGLDRVLIVDWDVHHGNGTQHAFEADPSVLFFSIHQYPHFPHTGMFVETGRAKGEGYTINMPISGGYGDAEYAAILDRVLKPVAKAFGPDLILVSAGFDAHEKDPLGGMRMSSAGFGVLTRVLMEVADDCCEGRLVLVLEGGYQVGVIGDCVRHVLRELTGMTRSVVPPVAGRTPAKKVDQALQRLKRVHHRFWRI